MKAREFRAELVEKMPGYKWTIHRHRCPGVLVATGTQSSGSNRLSTLEVTRREGDDGTTYEARSAGYGLKAPWLSQSSEGTLARALRSLQDHYERHARSFESHRAALEKGRRAPFQAQ